MEKEAIRDELNKVQSEIKKLKSDFFNKKDEKENFFSKGEEYSTEINQLYEEVKKIEQEHHLDKINEDLDAKKSDLDSLKTQIEDAEKKFNSVRNSSRRDVKKPTVRTVSTDKAKKEIKALDLKLQTQVLSLDKEQELIRKITDLKELVEKQGGNGSSVAENSELKSAKRELNSLRRKYSNYEKRVRSLYKQIRLISKEKKQRYKRIDELRDLKKKAFEEFRVNKKDYSSIGKDLKSLFKKEEELLTQLGESPVQKKRQSDKEIREKKKELEDKLMTKGGTLTTEDLLLFQSKK